MTFSEFLRKEFKTPEDAPYYFDYWKENLAPEEWIPLATSWHQDEVKRMLPSKEALMEYLLPYAYQNLTSVNIAEISEALRTFLESRVK